ncbi:hypothetical protein CYMTET_55808 [Cymbomonas tetramitiformis]|uniref:Uncharacterized protein n=1 Tax=Cymbomonas tetramitiformis TaxID=36881 RepID=A0AAE0EN02_9CHLO|nr:hypothetical protein CYMTET_55808 [Cymbomonas tetramitiformis]
MTRQGGRQQDQLDRDLGWKGVEMVAGVDMMVAECTGDLLWKGDKVPLPQLPLKKPVASIPVPSTTVASSKPAAAPPVAAPSKPAAIFVPHVQLDINPDDEDAVMEEYESLGSSDDDDDDDDDDD